jgi:nitrogen regulatory protein P-II 1
MTRDTARALLRSHSKRGTMGVPQAAPETKKMKLVTAIIQPPKLQAVLAGLAKVGVERMTVCDAQGYGRQRGRTEMYRGHEYKINLLRKVALEIVVNDDFLDRTLEVIINTARTGSEGNIGDGKIFIQPVEQTIRIGGVASGPEAV